MAPICSTIMDQPHKAPLQLRCSSPHETNARRNMWLSSLKLTLMTHKRERRTNPSSLFTTIDSPSSSRREGSHCFAGRRRTRLSLGANLVVHLAGHLSAVRLRVTATRRREKPGSAYDWVIRPRIYVCMHRFGPTSVLRKHRNTA